MSYCATLHQQSYFIIRFLDQAESLPEVFRDLFSYLDLKFQDNHGLVKFSDKRYKLLSRFYYVFPDEIHSGLPLIKGAVNNTMVKYRHSILRLDNILK